METLRQDLRYAARTLAKSPGFTAITALTLALGIGANTVVFSLLDTLYWRPLPVPDPAGLVHVFQTHRERAAYNSLTFPDYLDYRDRARSFEDLAAHYASAPINFATPVESKEINGSVVTANYFSVLGLRPSLGRFFLPQEYEAPGRDPVVVISDDWWRRQFDGDPQVLGKTIRLNATPFTIVGVAPRNFHGVLLAGLATDVWMPSAMFRVGYRYCDALQDRDCHIVALLGRLKAGRTVADAQRELDGIARRLVAEHPRAGAWTGVAVVPARGVAMAALGESPRTPALLTAAVGIVLVIACANVAGLLLVRAIHRRKEIAVRTAIGASRGRLIRQMLTESAMLALLGGAGGLIVAMWAKDLLLGFYTFTDEGQRAYFTVDPDSRVFLFSLAVSIATAAACGLVPALHGTRPDLLPALKEDRWVGPARSRLRDVLVVTQVALSLVLLVGAGLVTRSLANVYRGPGYDPSHIAVLRLRPSLVAQPAARAKAYHEAVIRRVAAMPGVVSASPADRPSLPGWDVEAMPVWLPDQPPARPDAAFRAAFNLVGPDYFATLGIPFLEGRDFDPRDRGGAPDVAIVNDVLARHYWPSASALGRILVVNRRPHRIIGVVKSAQYLTAAERPHPFVYTNFWQRASIDERPIDSRTHIRVAGDARTALPAIRRAIAAVDPDVPISEDRPLTEWLDYTFRPVRAAGTLLACFSALALFLCAIGLYGVLAATVGQRTREIAIRMALGARRRDVARRVIVEGARLTATGAVIGLALAFAGVRLLESFLYGVAAHDVMTVIVVSIALGAVTLLASCLPARRAMRVDPMRALRSE